MTGGRMTDFLDLVRQRLEMGARTIGIAERSEVDPRDGAEFARMIREELADVAAYAKLLDDRVQALATLLARVDRLHELREQWKAYPTSEVAVQIAKLITGSVA